MESKLIMPKTDRLVEAMFVDLDGVLVNSEPFKFLSYIQALTKNNFPIDYLFKYNFYDFYRRNCVGKSGEDNAKNQLEWCNKWLRIYNHEIGISWKEYREERMVYYKPIEDSLPLIEKNVQFVKEIGNSCKKYIVSRTNEERTKKIIEKAGLIDYVEIAVVPEKDLEKYSRAVRLAGENNIMLENCIAIEDSVEGVEEAKKYELYTIAIPNEFTEMQNFSKADMKTDDLSRLFIKNEQY